MINKEKYEYIFIFFEAYYIRKKNKLEKKSIRTEKIISTKAKNTVMYTYKHRNSTLWLVWGTAERVGELEARRSSLRSRPVCPLRRDVSIWIFRKCRSLRRDRPQDRTDDTTVLSERIKTFFPVYDRRKRRIKTVLSLSCLLPRSRRFQFSFWSHSAARVYYDKPSPESTGPIFFSLIFFLSSFPIFGHGSYTPTFGIHVPGHENLSFRTPPPTHLEPAWKTSSLSAAFFRRVVTPAFFGDSAASQSGISTDHTVCSTSEIRQNEHFKWNPVRNNRLTREKVLICFDKTRRRVFENRTGITQM